MFDRHEVSLKNVIVFVVRARGSESRERFSKHESRSRRHFAALSTAVWIAFLAYTVATWRLYSALAYESSVGSAFSAAFAAAALITCRVRDLPFNSASVATARIGPLPNPPIATRADAHELDDTVMSAPALTTTEPEAGWGNFR